MKKYLILLFALIASSFFAKADPCLTDYWNKTLWNNSVYDPTYGIYTGSYTVQSSYLTQNLQWGAGDTLRSSTNFPSYCKTTAYDCSGYAYVVWQGQTCYNLTNLAMSYNASPLCAVSQCYGYIYWKYRSDILITFNLSGGASTTKGGNIQNYMLPPNPPS